MTKHRLEEAHIDQRTWDNMSDRRVHSFMNDYPASRMWLARMASVLQSDVSASTAGQRFMNEEGTFTGQKRDTTPLLAEMKDSGYTWQQMSDVFGKMAEVFENGDLEVKVPGNRHLEAGGTDTGQGRNRGIHRHERH